MVSLSMVGAPAPLVMAQEAVGVNAEGSTLRFFNRLPVRIAILAIARDTTGASNDYVTLIVDSSSEASVPRRKSSETYVIVRTEAVHRAIGLHATTLPCDMGESGAALLGRITALKEQLEHLRLEGTPAAAAYVEAATKLAQLDLKRLQNEMEMRHLDFETSQLTPAATWQGLMRQERERREEWTEQRIGQWLGLAMAFSGSQEARNNVLAKQADAEAELATRVESAAVMVRRRADAAELEAQAGRAFNRMVAATLGKPTQLPLDPVLQQSVRLACQHASAVTDVATIRLATTSSIRALGAHFEFDRGGSDRVIFRRITDSDVWLGTFYWPTNAHTVSVTLDDTSPRMTLGSITADRPPLADVADEVSRTADEIRRASRETRFRSKDGDRLKSIIIPD